MKDRLKQLRKNLGLNQQDFADRIGINRGTLANYEVGRNEPIDAVIKLICDTFQVNEEWLRIGSGEMFIETNKDDDINRLVELMLRDETAERKKRLVTAILRLSPEQIEAGVAWMKEAFGLTDAPAAADSAEQKPFEEMTIDEKVESYRRELEAEEASKKLSVSQTESAEETGT